MRVLMTGSDGYLGTVMLPVLTEAGHVVQGMDTGFFHGCGFGVTPWGGDGDHASGRRIDVRDVEADDLRSFDAVIHLAALSNDPLGDLDPGLTEAINRDASVRLARLARAAGVRRFLFASSCSLYGVAGEDEVDETAPFNPITPYGRSKVEVEAALKELAVDEFSPTSMRNATAYGVSSALRLDVVVNNLVAHAVATGRVMLKSDGSPWRPLVHVEDIARAFLAVLEAPRDRVHARAFNVGRTEENYQIREVAELVAEAVGGSEVQVAEGAGADPRSYRVNCDLIQEALPGFRPRWTVPEGIRELRNALVEHGFGREELEDQRYVRLREIRRLLEEDRISAELRWAGSGEPSAVS